MLSGFCVINTVPLGQVGQMLCLIFNHQLIQLLKINIDANLCVLCQSLHIKGFFQRCVQTVDKCNNHFCCHIETCSQLRNRAFQLCYLFAEDIFIDFLFLGQIFLPNRFNAAAFLRKCLLHPIFIQAHLLSLLLFFLFLYKLLHSFK